MEPVAAPPPNTLEPPKGELAGAGAPVRGQGVRIYRRMIDANIHLHHIQALGSSNNLEKGWCVQRKAKYWTVALSNDRCAP